ncbi:MAG TPA: nucleoside-diphosphate sugar epimerase/dehydratase [Methylomirabilota bacterium]|nr:nucleoside-diphosphate sugar epimerase/dehydratase [Methylomirabilota bacterium]
MRRPFVTTRRAGVLLADALLAVAGNYLAFWLRFDGVIPPAYWILWLQTIPCLVLIRGLTFVSFHLYDSVWQYVGLRDLRAIAASVAASSVVFCLLIRGVLDLRAYPRSVFVVDLVLVVFFMGAVRVSWRLAREYRANARTKSVLIFGAGDAGEAIVREILNGGEHGYHPVGFVDDDPAKVGRRIHGVPVLGTQADLPRIIAETNPSEVLVAIARATPQMLRQVVKALESHKLPIKAVPHLRDVLDGRAGLHEVRDLAVTDLLGRAPVGLDVETVKHLVEGKRVLVTGAGGTIGSELSRQIAGLGPKSLVLFERYENALWAVERSVAGLRPSGRVYSVIADVTDQQRVDEVLADHRPELILHAAAHKHVPLMELNPCEAIKNNVKGTRIVGEAAVRHGVERFVLISSDKAVNPSSVMGATKRVAELLAMALAERGPTGFVVVRFGNVMGSNGSVIPLFLEQIHGGGPVTVTHPDMRRYFMSIPEAVQLVLQAAALDENGALYVLDMGEEIRVVDMARNLIRLSGFIPDREIPIVFTGIRPGEKLSEELVAADEAIEPSRLEGVRRVRSAREMSAASLARDVADLEHFAETGATGAVMQQLGSMVALFRPVLPAKPEVANGRPVPPVEMTKPAAVVGEARGAA